MMIVVADSSPLIVLLDIGHIDILPELFTHVVIPPEVAAELTRSNRPHVVREFIASAPPWLSERAPARAEAIPALHAAECAAISLARELNAHVLLIDEVRGRRAAAQRRIRFTGTIGVLELAAERGLLDLKDAFERIKQTDFWISHDLLDERLRLHSPREKS
ncbi:MAG TPA: DUF3368 domain-containing protein [Planctomycetes bacterium]|nr:DUF3368 domain-containing protein [Planctomycetota bacterium]